MIVFVCLDDNNGMTFNNRRQSRDSAVTAKITEMASGGSLLMSRYSARLFEGQSFTACEKYLDKAVEGDYCFVERESLAEYDEKIKMIVIFRWNRVYPSDRKLDISLDGRKRIECFDLKGSSHERITCEVWAK